MLAELKRMLHPRVFPVKNCLMLFQSTVTLCLVSNKVSRSFLVLVWPITGWSEVYFGSFLIGRPIFSVITSCILKRTCLRTFSTPSWMWRGRQRTTSRLDWIALFCNCKNMELVCDGSRVTKPRTSFVLEKNSQLLVYKWLKSLRFPDGHASNILRLVNTEECRLYGMKSHDCHVFMQTLIPLAFRDLLPKGIWDALTEISYFFRDIRSSKLNVDHIERLEMNIMETICKLEMIFPPSFFNSMEHLSVHLPFEVKVGGPVQYRWMYPFEMLDITVAM